MVLAVVVVMNWRSRRRYNSERTISEDGREANFWNSSTDVVVDVCDRRSRNGLGQHDDARSAFLVG